MKFTLKVIDDKKAGYFVPDDRSSLGGIDYVQRVAFNHLFPNGCCDWALRELLFTLAELHDWQVSVTVEERE